MLRLLFFLGLGIGLGGVVVQVVGPPGAGEWTIPVALILLIGSSTLIVIGRSMNGVQTPSAEDIAAARAAGRSALVRVDSLSQTGTQINDQPLCELQVTVRPETGPAFRTVVRRIVAVIDVPRFQPGTVHPGVVLLEGGPEVAILNDDGGVPVRVPSVPDAASAGPLLLPESGTRVSGGRRRRPLLGVGRRGRPARLALMAVLALVAATAVVLPYRTALTQTIAALPSGRWHSDLREPGPFRDALTALQAETGHDQLVSISVSDDLIVVDAPLTPGALPTDRLTYRRGSVERDGAATIQPRTPAEAFSTSELDWDGVWATVTTIAAERGYPLDGISLSVSRTSDSDVDSPTFAESVGAVRVYATVSDDYRSESIVMSADGALVPSAG
ncbi:hypothetical protein NY547_11630 [Cnuibacter physcomitrellae]|uniref:hypothetical protein n=1 Tax=Cnuibacter physcomitrellae TaxID=1619308 RepID=UPI0021757EDB|nr:hypothetical protein [Cnuibacter physcomitrellae]MCS5497888.1 hypothetical protein [Cnuibacter physcomitrellae]